MVRRWAAAGILLALGAAGLTSRATDAQSVARYAVRDLGAFTAFAIDRKGDVVGNGTVSGHAHPFLWQDQGGLKDLFSQVSLGGDNAYAFAVANSGSEGRIAGVADTPATPTSQTHAYALGSGGAAPGLADLNGMAAFNGGQSSQSNAVNAKGEVAGWAMKQDGSRHAFHWEPGGPMTDLGTLGGQDSLAWTINGLSEVGGAATDGNGENWGTVWSPIAGPQPVQVLIRSEVMAINDQRIVVGRVNPAGTNVVNAFVCDLKTPQPTTLPSLPGAVDTEGRGINNSGDVVGLSATGLGLQQTRAVLWRGGRIFDLNTRINAGGWRLIYALAVNDAGQITGLGMHNGNFRAFRLDPPRVPPTIVNARVAPRTLPSSGGDVTVTAVVTDPTPLSSVVAQVRGAAQTTLVLQPAGGNTYSRKFSAPVNTTHQPQKYLFTVRATNAAGQSTSRSAGAVTVAGQP